jgi:hypothetical protein
MVFFEFPANLLKKSQTFRSNFSTFLRPKGKFWQFRIPNKITVISNDIPLDTNKAIGTKKLSIHRQTDQID